jgi:DNA-binding beta-propeller fold protein YncE
MLVEERVGEPAPARRRMKRGAMLLSLAVAVLLLAAATAFAVSGQLTQLLGGAGCVSETGTSGACADGRALDQAYSVAVSIDGTSVYVASKSSAAVAAFQRDTTTGALTQLSGTAGCISDGGFGGTCAIGKALSGPSSVAVSPDGKNVYVASAISNAVAVFQRNVTTGELTQLAGTAGCVAETAPNGECTDGRMLQSPESVAVSPDGTSVYVASNQSSAVAVFRRAATTGALTQPVLPAGCIREVGGSSCRDGEALDLPIAVTVSPDGTGVYVTSGGGDSVAFLTRDTTNGALSQASGTAGCVSENGTTPSGDTCALGKALDSPLSVAVSSDNKNVYVASSLSDAVAIFRRNTTNNTLTQLVGPTGKAGCISQTGKDGKDGQTIVCIDGKALIGANSVVVSPDAKSVYVASFASDAITAFRRDTTSGALAQLSGTAGCVSESGSGGACADGKALDYAHSVAVNADGKSAYVASGNSDAVAIFARQVPAP